MGVYEEFLMRKFKAEQEFKKSKEYKMYKAIAIIGFIAAVVISAVILFI